MNKNLLCLLICLLLGGTLTAQSYAFGVKGGLTVGFQKWDLFEQDPSFKYHGIAFIETAPEDNAFAVFAQAGYHIKGSAIRNRNLINQNTGDVFRPPAREFLFKNVSLTAGAKQKFDYGSKDSKVYYMIGIRGDYTIGTNLEIYEQINNVFFIYPSNGGVRKFNYGVTVGGGMELPFSEYISGLIEFSVNPDFSLQYQQPPLNGIYNPFTGQNTTLRERKITNTTFELSVGLRFLVIVEYIDYHSW